MSVSARRTSALLAACVVTAAAAALAHLVLGRSGMGAGDAVAALLGHPGRRAHSLILGLRLPRIAGALAAGAALGAAGALLRYVTANPLAEPGLLGISSGAALGVVCADALGLGAVGATPPALAGATVAFALVALVTAGHGADRVRLVLSGVVVGAVLSALTAGVLAASGRPLGSVLRWLVGSLNPVTWVDLRAAAVPAVLGLILVAATGRRLGALRLARPTALGIGARPELTGVLALGAAVSLTAAAVLVAGAVAFLGLAAPEIARRAIGDSAPRYLLPASAVVGATLLVVADVLAVRTTVALPWTEATVTGVPVGALVAPLCVPAVVVSVLGGRRTR